MVFTTAAKIFPLLVGVVCLNPTPTEVTRPTTTTIGGDRNIDIEKTVSYGFAVRSDTSDTLEQAFNDYIQSKAWIKVSLKEVNIFFPFERIDEFRNNSSEENDVSHKQHHMKAIISGTERPYSFRIAADTKWFKRGQSFSSVNIDSVYRSVCWGTGMLPAGCSQKGLSIQAEEGGFLMTLRDSALIQSVFSLRPANTTMRYYIPHQTGFLPKIKIDYISPQIPLPDSAAFQRADSAREQLAILSKSGYRYLAGNYGQKNLSILEGDSVVIGVHEMLCEYDLCFSKPVVVLDSGWTVEDSSTITLHPYNPENDTMKFLYKGIRKYARAERRGTTKIRVRGLTSATDTVKMGGKLNKEVEMEISVIPRPTKKLYETKKLEQKK